MARKPKRHVGLWMPVEQWEWCRAFAKEFGGSASGAIIEAVEHFRSATAWPWPEPVEEQAGDLGHE